MQIELGIDHKELLYALRVILLAVLIVISSQVASRNLELYLSEADIPQVEAAGTGSNQQMYRQINDNAIIFSHGYTVREKQKELIGGKKDFIFTDLTSKNISIYREGELIKTFPIKATGKKGSFFETPSGLYKVQSKENNHFSTIGEVWMPWSMHFFGNYFIHGWPYYPDGTPVATSFSGGCIRLDTNDAHELFSLSAAGMPVLVLADEETPIRKSNYYQKVASLGSIGIRGRAGLPNITASAALAVDFDTDQILFEKNKDERHPLASVTKLMTGLVAVETINRFKVLNIDQRALDTFGETGGFVEGETFKSENLLYPLILASSNDAATVYAEQVGGFVDIMNQKARAIGLKDTFFKDTTGLTPENVSTPEDLFKLLKYIDAHKKPLFALSSLPEYTLTSENGLKTHTWKNSTWPKDDGRFIAGKFGYTPEAQQTLAAIFHVRLSEQGDRPIAIILMGSTDRIGDVYEIFSYLEKNFVYGDILVQQPQPDQKAAVIRTGANVFRAIELLSIPTSGQNAANDIRTDADSKPQSAIKGKNIVFCTQCDSIMQREKLFSARDPSG